MLAILRYLPAFVFLKINSHIGSPNARKVEIKREENNRLVFIEKLIFDFIILVSLSLFLSISFDCSLMDGIIVTASELISVDGIIKIGNVMPMIIPNSDSASSSVKP